MHGGGGGDQPQLEGVYFAFMKRERRCYNINIFVGCPNKVYLNVVQTTGTLAHRNVCCNKKMDYFRSVKLSCTCIKRNTVGIL